MQSRYFNPYTDFGFKKLFGEEGSKELLRDFLNSILPIKHPIETLSFKSPESLPDQEEQRKAIFDVYCQTEAGERLIVEMQKAKINFFKDRTVFYSTFPIREQAEKGKWDFRLRPVFCLAILDFTFDELARSHDNYLSTVQLRNQYCEVFYDKLMYVFVEMPRFNKTEDQLQTQADKWLYFLKNLEDFNQIPAILNEPVFQQGFEIAEIGRYTPQQMDQYEHSLKVYRDLVAAMDTAVEEGFNTGFEKGREEGREEHGRAL